MSLTIQLRNNNPSIKMIEVDERIKGVCNSVLCMKTVDEKAAALRQLVEDVEDAAQNLYILVYTAHDVSAVIREVSDEFYQALYNPKQLLQKEVVMCKEIHPYIKKGYYELVNKSNTEGMGDSDLKTSSPAAGDCEHLKIFTEKYLTTFRDEIFKFIEKYLTILEVFLDDENIIIETSY